MEQKDSFEAFFRKNYQRMIVYAYNLTGDEEDSRDIVQDAMEYAWGHFQDEQVDDWQKYIGFYVRNKCIDYLRHRNVHRAYADVFRQVVKRQEAPVYEESSERFMAVRHVMETLPPKTRQVMEECYINQKKYKEVAQELDITTHAVKKHVIKGLKVLREKFAKKA